MMYPFMTLNDDTEITHSEMKPDGSVKVYIETPQDNGEFHNATCWLPMYKWEINGYSWLEMQYIKQLIRNLVVENLLLLLSLRTVDVSSICRFLLLYPSYHNT